jgi:hypothetical protein
MSSSGALACSVALRLAAPHRLAAALAAAAPAEDILASLSVEIYGRGAAVQREDHVSARTQLGAVACVENWSRANFTARERLVAQDQQLL